MSVNGRKSRQTKNLIPRLTGPEIRQSVGLFGDRRLPWALYIIYDIERAVSFNWWTYLFRIRN